MMEETENEAIESPEKIEKKKKIKTETKRGVVYLSCIPRGMSLKRLREEMEKYGEVGNIYLEPDDKASHNPYKREYKEGWVEFLNKAVAKQVAAALNNTQVGGRKKHPWYEDIWNIKYLPRFQWAHLNARLAYEKGVYKQRLRADVSQIKREATFHKKNFLKNQIKKKSQQKGEEKPEEEPGFFIRQRETEDEILDKKRRRTDDGEDGGAKKKARRERKKKSMHRPDADHPVGALSLGANPQLLQKLFGGGSEH